MITEYFEKMIQGVVKLKLDKDVILVKKTLDGDIEAFSTLVSNYRSRVCNFLFKMTMCREDAEDIAQEVFIKAYDNLYRYDNRWCFSTWIYNIAVNLYRTEYKKRKKRDINYSQMVEEMPLSFGESPEYVYEVKENRQEIIKLINNLKFDQKAALILKHIQGFTYDEIGKILGITPGNARIKVMRAKQALIKKFPQYTGGAKR